MLNILILIAGFFPLIFGARVLVNNASALARRLNVPEIVIGLTIVGFGTSSPELVVNVIAAANGDSAIVLGNIVGSNIFNIMGILGISAIIYRVSVKNNTTWLEIPLALMSAVLVLVLAADIVLDSSNNGVLGRTDGIVMLLFFIVFLVYNINLAIKEQYTGETTGEQRGVFLASLLILAGLALLVAGGRIIVVSAVKVAEAAGISERIIALTIVSIGTSLPELATSVVAARNRNSDIAIGNIVGSNIFNVFFILGLSTVINPVPVQVASFTDIYVNIFASILLFAFVFTGKGRSVNRTEGVAFILLYVSYLALILLKG
jgi:cation:H+ antiporter